MGGITNLFSINLTFLQLALIDKDNFPVEAQLINYEEDY